MLGAMQEVGVNEIVPGCTKLTFVGRVNKIIVITGMRAVKERETI